MTRSGKPALVEETPAEPALTPVQIQQAWRLLNPAGGEHLSQLELSQNAQAVIPTFLSKDAAILTGPTSLLTFKQLQDILQSTDLRVRPRRLAASTLCVQGRAGILSLKSRATVAFTCCFLSVHAGLLFD